MSWPVVFTPAARNDLLELYDYIADQLELGHGLNRLRKNSEFQGLFLLFIPAGAKAH